MPLADPACAHTHVVAHTSNISRRMVQIMCLRYLAGASERGALSLPVPFPRVSTSDSVRRVHIARPSFGMTGVYGIMLHSNGKSSHGGDATAEAPLALTPIGNVCSLPPVAHPWITQLTATAIP